MKFFNTLQNTKLSTLRLLDISYVLVLLPLFIMLKVPMLVFIFIVGIILFIKKEPANNALVFFIFLLGILAVYLSLYGAFSFRGLSRLKLFLELLVYILLIVVAMQRLTRQINFYLLISPFLFLALSLFFYHGIEMLGYVVFEIFILLWLVLTHRMQTNLVQSFRTTMVMFLYSLPWVVVLFIFFPRISFEHADYGFKGEKIQRLGHDGTMHLDGKSLLVPSNRIVMEVGFESKVPPAHTLYFRGSILYIDKKEVWLPIPEYKKRIPSTNIHIKGKEVHYNVTLYPTQKKWIYLLDTPKLTQNKATRDRDYITTLAKPVKEPLHYKASSVLSTKIYDNIDTYTRQVASDFNTSQNPKTYSVAKRLKASYPKVEQRAQAMIGFFKSQSLTYSLKPKPLDTNHSGDSFLFDTHQGYCVHFASSFVTMSRMAGIPARIVTGYKADVSNSMNNYLAIKEKDAHAWAELYINKHWIRYETTATASFIDIDAQNDITNENHSKLYNQINLYLMYAKYQVETWILSYSNIRQLQLLKYAKEHPQFIVNFVLSLLIFILLIFMIIAYFKRPIFSSKSRKIINPLIQQLEKEGFMRLDNESIHQYLERYMQYSPKNIYIKKLDLYYELIVYGNEKTEKRYKELKELVKLSLKHSSINNS